MDLNSVDVEFTANFMRYMMIERPQWRPDLKDYEKIPPELPFTQNMQEKIKHALTLSDYEEMFGDWFHDKPHTIEHFKNLVKSIVEDYGDDDYDVVSFFNFFMELSVTGYCGYLFKISSAPDYVLETMLQTLKNLREKGQFTDESYTELDEWAEASLEEIRIVEEDLDMNEIFSSSESDYSSSGFNSNTSCDGFIENSNKKQSMREIDEVKDNSKDNDENIFAENVDTYKPVQVSLGSNFKDDIATHSGEEFRAFRAISMMKNNLLSSTYELQVRGACSESFSKEYLSLSEKTNNMRIQQKASSPLDDIGCIKRKIGSDDEMNSANESINSHRPIKRQNSRKTNEDRDNEDWKI